MGLVRDWIWSEVYVQQKDNIIQRINTFLDREEVWKNKYKPRRTSQRPISQQNAHSSVQEGKVQVGQAGLYKSARRDKILIYYIISCLELYK